MREIVIASPLEGWAASLAEVPDPVFAQRMLGDGVAIDPTAGELRAPCDGLVVALHAAGHAVTVRSHSGVEILIHIGIDTVKLEGRGFEPLVAVGSGIQTGQPLLRFDLESLARAAPSLISPVIVANGERFGLARARAGARVGFGEPLLFLERRSESGDSSPTDPAVRSRLVRVGLEHGLHARPAARLARRAGEFRARIRLAKADREADVASPVSLMALGVSAGDEVEICAAGPDAEEAIDALAEMLGKEPLAQPPHSAQRARETILPIPGRGARPGLLHGVAAAPGVAFGRATRLHPAPTAPAEAAGSPGEERARLEGALAAVGSRLARPAQAAGADILGAHLALLDDPELRRAAEQAIGRGASAGFAWREALEGFRARLEALSDPRLRARAADLIDLERQVLAELAGADLPSAELPAQAIVLAGDLLPSELLSLDRDRLVGVALAAGGPTAHVALIAQSLGVPMVVAFGEALEAVAEGTELVIDGDAGRLDVVPDTTTIAAARRRGPPRQAAATPCRTADGERIEVFANLGRVEEAAPAVALGAEGCGLLRSEFLFMDRAQAPDEAEQRGWYQAIADALQGRSLIIRTLDAGADKPIAYLARQPEPNPALGVRGVRLWESRPDLIETQLRAALSVRPQPAILLPMVASLDELRAGRALGERVATALGVGAPRLGVMIETPAAALIADRLAAEADFLSIGTNDLAQYALAMDRTLPALAARIDALDPAVLRLIELAARGGAAAGKPVAMCGALAADPAATAILIGLGIRELSVAAAAIPALAERVRGLALADCRRLAARALACGSAAEVRAILES